MTDRTDPSDAGPQGVGERVAAGLAKLGLVMRHEAWRASGERGLTPTQSQILSELAGAASPLGLTGVAERLAITMGTASSAVSTLVDKGLVEKRPSPADARAIELGLTARGRREASAAGWPEVVLSSVRSLPAGERGMLVRGLVGLIRELQSRGAVPTARMCVGCRYFRPNEHPGSDAAHHCAYIDAPIGDADLRVDCPEMEPVEAGGGERLWRVFIEGEPLDGDGPGRAARAAAGPDD